MRFIVDEITKVADEGQRKTILYGEVERGVLRKGMNVHFEILGQSLKVDKIRDGEEQLGEASVGQQVGVIVAGLQNVRVQLGEVLVDTGEDDV